MWSLTDQLHMLNDGEGKSLPLQFSTLAENYGITYFALLSDVHRNQTINSTISHNNWPSTILQKTTSLRFDEIPELAKSITENIAPFYWNNFEQQIQVLDDRSKLALDLIEDIQLLTGLVIPVKAPDGTSNAAIFGSPQKPLEQQDIAFLQYSTFTIFEQIWKENRETENETPVTEFRKLSARETECLHWCAQGKTSSEIGIILGLSEFTVNNYLYNATAKLNAASRTQAVAEAIRCQLI